MTSFHAPSDDLLEAIEGRWTLHILLCLKEGAHRFSDLRAAIPRISSNVLTERMRTLEHAGLVERHYLPPPSASHVYQLAAAADGLRAALDALASWRAERAANRSQGLGVDLWPRDPGGAGL